MRIATLLRVSLSIATLVAPAAAQTGPTTVYVQTQPGQGQPGQGASQGVSAVPAPILFPQQPAIALPPPSVPRNAPVVADDVMTLGRPPATPATGNAVPSSEAVVQRSGPALVQTPVPDSMVGRTVRGKARVIDGNTVSLGGTLVVLHGADAPEIGQTCFDAKSVAWRCGEKASRHLDGLVGQKTLVCTGVEDLPGAVAATCISGNTDFGKTMVRDGFAVVPDYLAPLHSAEQAEARAAARGLWVGSFVKPDKYRAGL